MSTLITPAAILETDYAIARRPTLGGELRVYFTTEPHGLTQVSRFLGGSNYETEEYATGLTSGVELMVVGVNGLSGAITGVIEKEAWQAQTAATTQWFATGRAGVGALGDHATWAAGGEIKRGQEIMEISVPDYDPATNTGGTKIWFPLGAVDDRSIKIPSRISKAIADGFTSARWVAPAETVIGELSLTAKNVGDEDGLMSVAGQDTCVMIQVIKSGLVHVANIFLTNWIPTLDRKDPTSGETTITATGQFSAYAVVLAPGDGSIS